MFEYKNNVIIKPKVHEKHQMFLCVHKYFPLKEVKYLFLGIHLKYNIYFKTSAKQINKDLRGK